MRTLYLQCTGDDFEAATKQLCAFCDQLCGLTIRQCAEVNGGRRALKRMVRGLEELRNAGRLPEELKSTLKRLFDAYVRVSEAMLTVIDY